VAVSIVDQEADGCVVSCENIIACISLWSSIPSLKTLGLISDCLISIKLFWNVAISLLDIIIQSGFAKSLGDIHAFGHIIYFLFIDCLIACDLADLLKLKSFCNPITGLTIQFALNDSVSSNNLTIQYGIDFISLACITKALFTTQN
jgi:hypothetical protein